jgi:hypothetical protein
VVSAELHPGAESSYYAVAIHGGYDPYHYRNFYGGEKYVFVDGHDPAHTKVVDGSHEAARWLRVMPDV